jgi:hypothetical protein
MEEGNRVKKYLALVILIVFGFLAGQIASAAGFSYVDLVKKGGDVNFKPVFYQLKDSEGGSDEVYGRKSPAFIIKTGPGPRDEQGRQLFNIFVMPTNGKPAFSTIAPFDSERRQGTIDDPQPGDLVN